MLLETEIPLLLHLVVIRSRFQKHKIYGAFVKNVGFKDIIVNTILTLFRNYIFIEFQNFAQKLDCFEFMCACAVGFVYVTASKER